MNIGSIYSITVNAVVNVYLGFPFFGRGGGEYLIFEFWIDRVGEQNSFRIG